MAPGSVTAAVGVARVCTCVADTRYLSICLLRRARRNLYFYPPKLGDRPPTGELIRSFVLLATTAAVTVTTYAAVVHGSPVTTQ